MLEVLWFRICFEGRPGDRDCTWARIVSINELKPEWESGPGHDWDSFLQVRAPSGSYGQG